MNQIVTPNRTGRRLKDAMMSHAAPLALALEPRYMFDAAGAATGADAVREATASALAAEAAPAHHDDGSVAALYRAVADHALPVASEAPAPAEDRKVVLFVDGSVPDGQRLIDAAGPGVEVVLLDPTRDGLAQMAAWAEGKQGYDAIHLVTHGSIGTLRFSTLTLTAVNAAERASDLAAIGGALTDTGDILLYGCDIGQGDEGATFLAALADLTGADVAASNDGTGGTERGGNWVLEARHGDVDDKGLYDERVLDYAHLLAVPSDGLYDVAGTFTTSVGPGTTIDAYTAYPEWRSSWGILTYDGGPFGSKPSGGIAAIPGDGVFLLRGHQDDLYEDSIDTAVHWFRVAADGVNVASFELTDLKFYSYDGDSIVEVWNLSIVGVRADGLGNVTATVNNFAHGSETSIAASLTAFVGVQISSVTINFSGTVPQIAGEFTFTDIGIKNATPPVTNERPVVDLNGATAGQDVSRTFVEKGGAIAVAPDATITDADAANTITSMTVTLGSRPDGNAVESLSPNASALSAASGAGLTAGYNSATGVFSVTGSASRSVYETVLRGILYNNTSNDPTAGNRSVTVTVTDSSGAGNATSSERTSTIAVTPVNDAPSVTVTGNSVTYTEDAAAVGGLFSSVTLSAVESGQTMSSFRLTAANVLDGASEVLRINGVNVPLTAGTVALGGGHSATVASAGGTSYTVTVTLAAGTSASAAQTLISGIAYQHLNTGNPTDGNRTVTLDRVTDSGGTANGGVDTWSGSVQATVNVDPVNDLPAAGGAVTVTAPDGSAISIVEDSPAPGAANIRLAPTTLTDADGQTPTAVRITAVTGGTLTQSDGSPITLGTSGTALTLTGGAVNLRFTPDANRDTAASFTYVVVDPDNTSLNGPASTATINITPVPDTPSVTNATTLEDTQSTTGLVISPNVVDTVAPSHYKITNISGGTLFLADGTTAVTAGSFITAAQGAAGLRFTPTANSNTAGSFDVQASSTASDAGLGGGVATATVNITPVNDAPTITDGATITLAGITEAQTSAVSTVASLLTAAGYADVENETGGIAVTAASGPGAWQYSTDGGANWTSITGVSGTASLLLGATAQVRFVPADTVGGSASLTFRGWDGTSGTAGSTVNTSTNGNATAFSTGQASVAVTVSDINDAPVLTAPASATAVEQVQGAISGISITDVDAGSGTITAALGVTTGTLGVSLAGGATISAGANNSAALTLSGTLAQVNAALATLTYTSTSDTATSDTLSITVNDGGNTGTGGALEATGTVAITITPVNDAPVIGSVGAGPATAVAGAGFTAVDVLGAVTLTDVDSATFNGGTLTITRTSGTAGQGSWGTAGAGFTAAQDVGIGSVTTAGAAGANLVIALDARATPDAVRDFIRALQYDGGSTLEVRAFSLSVVDGGGTANGGADTATATFSIRVQPNPPVITGLNGGSRTHVEGAGATLLAAGAVTVNDADTANFAGGTVTVTITANGAGGDLLQVVEGNGITVVGTEVFHNAVKVADITQAGSNTQPLILTYATGGGATQAAAGALLGQIGYATASDAPSAASRTITVVMTDAGSGDIGSSSVQTITMAVTPTDDQPVIGGAVANQPITDKQTVTPFAAVTVSEPDGETVTVTVSIDTAAKGSFTTLNGFTAGGTAGTWTFTGSAAAAQAALQGMVFTPAENRGVPGSTETATFTIAVEDHDGVTDPVTNATTSVVVTSVNDAPTLTGLGGDSMTMVAANGPQALTIAADVVVGDPESHIRGGTLTLTQTSGTAGSWGLGSGTSGVDGVFAAGETVTVGGAVIGTVTTDGQSGAALVIALDGAVTEAQVAAFLAALTYDPGVGTGARTFTATLNDGDGTANGGSASVTTSAFTITVTGQPPVVTGLAGGTVTFTEGGAAVRLDPEGDATVTDLDSAAFGGGEVRVSITANGVPGEDVLSLQPSADGRLTVVGSEVFWDHDNNAGTAAVKVADIAGGTAGAPLVLTLTADARPGAGEAVAAMLRNIAYANTNTADPSTASRTVSVQVRDAAGGDAGVSTPAAVTVAVAAVNDPPVLTGGVITGATNTEGVDSSIWSSPVTAITDPDATAFNGARIIADIDTTGANPLVAGDRLGIATLGNVGYTATGATTGDVYFDISGVMTRIGSAVWVPSTGTLTVTFLPAGGGNPTVTEPMVREVMNRLVYWTSGNDPTQKGTTPDRTITVTFEDGGNTGSGTPAWPTVSGTLTITDANDAPTVTLTGSPTFQTGGTSTFAAALTLSDVDGTHLSGATVTLAANPDGAAEGLVLPASVVLPAGVTIGGGYVPGDRATTITLTGDATIAEYQAVLRQIVYANTATSPATTPRSIEVAVTDRPITVSDTPLTTAATITVTDRKSVV